MTPDERLGRIEQRLDDLCDSLLDNGQPGVITQHNNRLTALEGWRESVHGTLKFLSWAVPIALTIAGAVWAAVKK